MPGDLQVEDLIVAYGDHIAIKRLSLSIKAGAITAIIGPSGCGKTTLLRCMNRLTDITDGVSIQGAIKLDGTNIFTMDPVLLRRRVGMVFQKANPFPMSIRENVIYGVKAQNTKKSGYKKLVENSLSRAVLWDEVKDRLDASAFALSVGQQQRLCIARALAVDPEIVLMDEPAAALDPVSTAKLEDGIIAMRGQCTVIVVTHDIQEALRVSDYTAFLWGGELVEYGPTKKLFEDPENERTRDYISGRLIPAGTTATA
jgi:phosphate transport system ATP-binding protein